MTSTIIPTSTGPSNKRRKLLGTENIPSIATSQGPKSSPSYSDLLYRLGIFDGEETDSIPPLSEQNQIRQYFPKPKNISLVADFLTTWFLECEPNEATLVQTICHHVFPWKFQTPNEQISNESRIFLLLEFLGSFRGHNLHELRKGDGAIKYPLIKRDASQEYPQCLQTPAQDDLKSRSDFVFAASIMILDRKIRDNAQIMTTASVRLPCLSNDLRSCAVAIVAEAKATSLPTSRSIAKIQWSSVAYLHMMERISIARQATYADDKNICQYGYIICGLSISVWKMSLRLNIGERRQSDLLNEYFTFPMHCLGNFHIGDSIQLEDFVKLHKQLLSWWINEYVPSYVNDITNIVRAHPNSSKAWISSWQQELEKYSPRSTESEKQATGKDFEATNDGIAPYQSPGQSDPMASEEQPTGSDFGAENDGTGYDGKSTAKIYAGIIGLPYLFQSFARDSPKPDSLAKEK